MGDVVRLRLQAPTLADGTILIDPGLSALTHSRHLLFAAACWAAAPRPVYYSRKPAKAQDYMRSVRLAPPEKGSFVLVIDSPVGNEVAPGVFAPPPVANHLPGIEPANEEPYPRLVILTLARSVQAAQSAVNEAVTVGSNEVAPFLQRTPQGITANLCDALAGLVRETGAMAVELNIDWHPFRPVPPELKRPSRFTTGAADRLSAASRILRQRNPEEQYLLVGRVIALRRDLGDVTGEITVETADRRHIRVELADPQYGQAVDAHNHDQTVRCTGVRRSKGRLTYLEEPTHFTVDPTLL
jgi:hypothetical protein